MLNWLQQLFLFFVACCIVGGGMIFVAKMLVACALFLFHWIKERMEKKTTEIQENA